jgi:hypothetical protein
MLIEYFLPYRVQQMLIEYVLPYRVQKTYSINICWTR